MPAGARRHCPGQYLNAGRCGIDVDPCDLRRGQRRRRDHTHRLASGGEVGLDGCVGQVQAPNKTVRLDQRKVVANHVFKTGELNSAAVEKIMADLRSNGYKNVAILKFAVAKPNGAASYDAGLINANLAAAGSSLP